MKPGMKNFRMNRFQQQFHDDPWCCVESAAVENWDTSAAVITKVGNDRETLIRPRSQKCTYTWNRHPIIIHLVQFGLFLSGFSIISLIKLKTYIECFMSDRYCITLSFYYADMYKDRVAIVHFLESQYFSFHEEKSWIIDNDLFFFLV